MGGGLECMESLRVTSWAEGGGAERDMVVDDMAKASELRCDEARRASVSD